MICTYYSFVCALATLISCGGANFLRASSNTNVDLLRLQDVEAFLSWEHADGLDQTPKARRLSWLQTVLDPMFAALPKNDKGYLGQAAVRYALHRFFSSQHGWFIKGLEPARVTWNASSPASILKDRVPSYIENYFEQRLGSRGFGLHDLAVLAATIEQLIHNEAMERLQSVFHFLGLPLADRITMEEATDVLDAYIVAYILGGNLATMSAEELQVMLARVESVYPGWIDTRLWVSDLQYDVEYVERGRSNPFIGDDYDFRRSAHVVEEFGERYGRWQDLECRSLKRALLDREEGSSGRVPLTEFYRKGLTGHFLFTESIAYLRELGALDESDPQRPTVVVPNYMNSVSNCVASSSFYALCCVDECEALMGSIEKEIAAPSAAPSRIAEVVSSLPSDTVETPRNLSSSLLMRLAQISDKHNGQIPVHGRLFAQWMHHAYPRECSYPQTTDSTKPRTPNEWMRVTKQEMRQHAASSPPDLASIRSHSKLEELPWSEIEELLEPKSLPIGTVAFGWKTLACNLFLVGALLVIFFGLVSAPRIEVSEKRDAIHSNSST